MRRLFLLLIWWCSGIAWAQAPFPESAASGDDFYQAEQYSKALVWFSAAVARDSTDAQSMWMAAESLRHLFRYPEAREMYRRVYQGASRQYPQAEYYYALMLQQTQQCEKALPLLDHFISAIDTTHPLAQDARRARQGCYESDLETTGSALALSPLPAPLNSPAQDYAVAPYQHDSSLVITSGRWQTSHRRIDYRYGENRANLFLWERTKEKWKPQRRPPHRWNTNDHDGPGCFNEDNTEFYFTRCQDNYCRIYVSEQRGGKWQSPTVLNASVNAPRSNSKHPALSSGGDTLYFASDRPGGYGGTDLWRCVKDSASGWRGAHNLGEAINTPADEISPYYYAPEDLLVFASRGYGGGGMDLYGIASYRAAPTPPVPERLPAPFNTPQDDCFLVMGHRRGFLSSNRSGHFDVYAFTPDTATTLTEQLFQNSFLSPGEHPSAGLMSDRVLPVNVSLPPPSEDIMVVYSVGEERLSNGSSRFILNSDVNAIALRQLQEQRARRSATAAGESVRPSRTDRTSLIEIRTDFIPTRLKGEVTGTLLLDTNEQRLPSARARVLLLNSAGKLMKITSTNEQGRFHFVNLAPADRYTIALATPPDPQATYHVEQLDVREYGEEVTTTAYETLYFDFNQSALRPEARESLKDLAAYYRKHPQTAIELNAYADSLGNEEYNQQLSQQRGESVFNYLLEQGVDRSYLVINAQGVSTSQSATNSLVSQQLNRRVEIQLIGEDVDYYQRAETRILRPNVSLDQLLNVEGIERDELQRLNGRPVDQSTPLKPLRVPVLDTPAMDQFFFDINYK